MFSSMVMALGTDSVMNGRKEHISNQPWKLKVIQMHAMLIYGKVEEQLHSFLTMAL
jgi:hypothetical protein